MSYNVKDFDVFIGIDVDQKSYSFTVKEQEQTDRSCKIPARPENLYKYIKNMYNDKRIICAYETGGTGYNLHDFLSSKQICCLMVPPLSIPKAGNDRIKNNRLDSEKIAQHLKNGEMLPIRIPDYEYRELRQLIRSREDYAESGKITKQRIKALLLFAYLYPLIKDPAQNWSYRYIQELKVLPTTPATRHRLDMLLMDLEYSRKQKLRVIKELKSLCKQNTCLEKNINYLRSIPGIGFIIAATILANIGDPKQLRNVRELAAFAGLVPSEHSTGDRVLKGHITHLGNNALRSLLIESAWIIIQKNTRLKQFYNRIRAKHHPSIGARKAIVAVARKLTMIIYKVLKEQREFIDYQ